MINTYMSKIDNIRQGLARLASTVETIANTQAAEMPAATVNSISGNAIHGGKITLLRSTGVKDNATRTSLLVDDDLITVGNIDTDNLIGDIDVSGALNVQGKLTVGNLHVEEMSSTQKVTQNIDFHAQGGNLDMMGMQWRKEGEATKQIIWRGDRFYISNTIDLHRNAVIEIDNIPVLSAEKLGVTIKHSELETVGTLNNLRSTGNLTIDDFVTYDSGTMRLGIGSEVPKYTAIGIGMWLGIIMAFNVWFVIWPNQKRALGIVECEPDLKAKSAKTAMLFSRTNTLLSLPMLLSMVIAQNLY